MSLANKFNFKKSKNISRRLITRFFKKSSSKSKKQIPKKQLWKKIISGLSILLTLITIFLAIYTTNLGYLFAPVPINVRLTNISPQSITITWLTKRPSRGRVAYATTTNLSSTIWAYDDKDQQIMKTKNYQEYIKKENVSQTSITIDTAVYQTNLSFKQAKRYYTHSVTITNLQAESQYFFKLNDYFYDWQANDVMTQTSELDAYLFTLQKFTATTAPSINDLPVPNPSYGQISIPDQDKSNDWLVFSLIEIPSIMPNGDIITTISTPLSSLINNQGGYYFDLSNVRSDLGEPLQINDNTGINQYIFLETIDQTYQQKTTLDRNAPVPIIDMTTNSISNKDDFSVNSPYVLGAQAVSNDTTSVTTVPEESALTSSSKATVSPSRTFNDKHDDPEGLTYLKVCKGCLGGADGKTCLSPAKGCGMKGDTPPSNQWNIWTCSTTAPLTPKYINSNYITPIQDKLSTRNWRGSVLGSNTPTLDTVTNILDGEETYKIVAKYKGIDFTPDGIEKFFLKTQRVQIYSWQKYSQEQVKNVFADIIGKELLPPTVSIPPTGADLTDYKIAARKYRKFACRTDNRKLLDNSDFDPSSTPTISSTTSSIKECSVDTNGKVDGISSSSSYRNGEQCSLKGETYTYNDKTSPQWNTGCSNGKVNGQCTLDDSKKTDQANLKKCSNNTNSTIYVNDPSCNGPDSYELDPADNTNSHYKKVGGSDGSGAVADGSGAVADGSELSFTPIGNTICIPGNDTFLSDNDKTLNFCNGTQEWKNIKCVSGTKDKIINSLTYACTDKWSVTNNTTNTKKSCTKGDSYLGNTKRILFTCVGTSLETDWISRDCNQDGPFGNYVCLNNKWCNNLTNKCNDDGSTRSCVVYLSTDSKTLYDCENNKQISKKCIANGSQSNSKSYACINNVWRLNDSIRSDVSGENSCNPNDSAYIDSANPSELYYCRSGWFSYYWDSITCSKKWYGWNQRDETAGFKCVSQVIGDKGYIYNNYKYRWCPANNPNCRDTIATGLPYDSTEDDNIPLPISNNVVSNAATIANTNNNCTGRDGCFSSTDNSCVCTTEAKTNDMTIRKKNSWSVLAIENNDKTKEIIINSGGYYVTSPESGFYLIEDIETGNKYTAHLYNDAYNLVYLDNDKSGYFNPDRDKILQLNNTRYSFKQVTQSHDVILKPGYNFISFPYIFKDGFSDKNQSKYYFSRKRFLEKMNEDLPDNMSVTLMSRFANGNFDDTVAFRKDLQQVYDKDNGIVPGEGYVVRLNGHRLVVKQFQFFVPETSTLLQLGSGWNLVGVYSPLQRFTAGSFIERVNGESSFNGRLENITRWDNGLYNGLEVSGGIEFGFDFSLDPFTSYFMRVDGKGRIKP